MYQVVRHIADNADKPNLPVSQRERIVFETAIAECAQAARLELREQAARGSSDWYTVRRTH